MRIGVGLVVLAGLLSMEPAWARYLPCDSVSVTDREQPVGYRQPWKGLQKLSAKDVPTVAALMKAAGVPIVVEGADFHGQSFVGVKLVNVCFYDTDLTATDWRSAEIDGVVFSQTKFNGAKLAKARFKDVQFFDSTLDDADATGVALIDSRIDGGSFDGLKLHRAALIRSGLVCSLFSGDGECDWPYKKGVDVTGATLKDGELAVYATDHWNFAGATLDNWAVQLGQLPQFATAIVKAQVRIGSSGYGTGTYAALSAAEWRSLVVALKTKPQHAGTPAEPAGIGWLKPGARLFYVDRDLPVATAWKKTATYRKLLPVIYASSNSTVVVDVRTPDTIAASGGAMGGNGHECTIDGEFHYNAKTGWFGALHSEDWKKDFPSADPFENVIRLTPNVAEVENAHSASNYPEYVGCGARAGFVDMQRLPMTPEIIRDLPQLPNG